jgi:5-methylcytosine-specific restriction protein A
MCGARSGLEVDHIIPVAKGGSWEPENLWTLCKTCHTAKTKKFG